MILISGASGRCGSAVVRRLLDRGLPVRVMTRYPGQSAILEQRCRGAEVWAADMLQPSSMAGMFEGITRALLISTPALGYDGEVTAACNFIRAAKSKIESIVFQSVIYADSRIPHCQTKGRIEAFLKEEVETFSILRPGVFTDAVPMRQILSAELASFSTTGIAPDVPVDWIKVDSLADATVAALTQQHPPNRIWDVAHPDKTSWHGIAQLLSAILGRRIDYTPVPGAVRDIVRMHSNYLRMPMGTAERFLSRIDYCDEPYFAPISERSSWCDPQPLLDQFRLSFPPLMTWFREEAICSLGHTPQSRHRASPLVTTQSTPSLPA